MHYKRWWRRGDAGYERPSVEERFWAKVDVRDADDCWPWLGGLDEDGYGSFCPTHATRVRAHRFAYELSVGAIPVGLEIDHRCHDQACAAGPACQHRRCVNHAHLAPATTQENLARSASLAILNAAKTHCKRGHPLSGDNLRICASGSRECKECRRDIKRRYDERQRAARPM